MSPPMTNMNALDQNTVLDRQFHELREVYPAATLEPTTHPLGNRRLTVPGCRLLKPDAFDRNTATLMAILPLGFPQASPDAFYFNRDLRLSHGGFVPTAVDTEGDFARFYAHARRWHPNVDTLLTVVNFMRVALGDLARDPP